MHFAEPMLILFAHNLLISCAFLPRQFALNNYIIYIFLFTPSNTGSALIPWLMCVCDNDTFVSN